ncbi:MAG: nucleoside kinase [Muribaculaceae bacterium]|nr:nucleoside kinase [Muribaculaceae bacterium]
MMETTLSAEQQQPQDSGHISLEEFCGNIRRMESQGQDGVALFNEVISQGLAPDLIAEDEVQHSRRLERITTEITRRFRQEGMRVVLVAGPSCSGKTTTSRFLNHMLRDNGIQPCVVSLDNYFLNLDQRPLDPNGNIDYESFYGLDVKQLGRDVASLLAGDQVSMPTYDYVKGERTYRGNTLKLESNSLLFLEGLHALNPLLVPDLPEEKKFRLFVTAQATIYYGEKIGLDEHDNRLLRRIYRDYNSRGASALQTLQWWPGVLRGENLWILPFASHADAWFNTSMVFEFSAIKSRVAQLLREVPESEPVEYKIAQRLIAILDRIAPLTQDDFAAIAPKRRFLLSNEGK